MPNLIETAGSISDEDLRLQIALFEMINFQNLVKETASKAAGVLKEAFNKLSGKQGAEASDQELLVPNKVKTLVNARINELKGIERTELKEHLIKILAERGKMLESALKENINEDFLSVFVIRQSAKGYGLDTHTAAAHLAELVRDKYQEQFLSRLHKNLVRETIQERRITDNNLQFYLNKTPIESIRELNKRVKLSTFSGQGIGQLVRTEKGVKNLQIIIEYIGIDAFDVEQTLITCAYDAMLGINRFTRVMFAQLIWNVLRAYGSRFRIYPDTLPSYALTMQEKQTGEEEKEFFAVNVRRTDLKKDAENLNYEMKKWNENMLSCQDKVQAERDNYSLYKNKLADLESVKTVYEAGGVKTPAEVKKYYADVITAQREYTHAETLLEKLSDQINELKLKLEKNNTEYTSCKSELDGVEPLYQELLKKREQTMHALWTQHYDKIEFAKGFFTHLVEQFRYTEILEIEELLEEMYESSDCTAYADETILYEEDENGDAVWYMVKCQVAPNIYANLIYKNSYIKSIIKS